MRAHLDGADLLTSLRPLDRQGLHETVLAQLLSAIRNGQLKPGEHLREVDIAERLGLSRGIVREAIRRLEQQGLVTTQQSRGAFVARLSAEEVAEIYSLRRVLEAWAIRLAVPRLDDAALEELATIAQSIVTAANRGDRSEHTRLDLRFHEQICLLSGHRHLHKAWCGPALKLWLVNFQSRDRNDGNPVRRASAHMELIDLLRRRETEGAVAWIENHIDSRAQIVLREHY